MSTPGAGTARVFVLLGHDPDTGAATVPVGVLGVGAEGERAVSWMPYEERDGGWRARVATATAPDALEHWAELADGVGWDILEVAGPSSSHLRDDVEAVLDELLAAGGS